MNAAELFENAMEWLREHYTDYRFFTERDIAWMVQLWLRGEMERQGLDYHVFNDHTMMPKVRSDIAIVQGSSVEVAAEFKYEPDSSRRADKGGDIWPTKFPVVADWKEAERDIERVQNYISQSRAKVAYSVVIDEGGRHKWRTPPNGSEWRDWGDGQWVLWSRWQ